MKYNLKPDFQQVAALLCKDHAPARVVTDLAKIAGCAAQYVDRHGSFMEQERLSGLAESAGEEIKYLAQMRGAPKSPADFCFAIAEQIKQFGEVAPFGLTKEIDDARRRRLITSEVADAKMIGMMFLDSVRIRVTRGLGMVAGMA